MLPCYTQEFRLYKPIATQRQLEQSVFLRAFLPYFSFNPVNQVAVKSTIYRTLNSEKWRIY